jgi:HK97 family phage portal protein
MRRWLMLKAVSVMARALGLTDPRLYQFFGGGPTVAGETVSIQTAMQIDTVFACVKLISQTIATLPLDVRMAVGDGEEGLGVLAKDHRLYSVLHDQPNADMTAVTFLTAMFACLLLWGNAYAAIDRRPDGSVIALTPLMPMYLTVTRQSDGSLLYHYARGIIREDFTEDQIFHLKGFTLDGIVGLSPIYQGRESMAIAIAAEKSAAAFFKNSMRPSMVISTPTYLTETQRNRYGNSFMEEFTGSINAGKVPILEGGWKIDQISMNPEDAQLLASRAFSVEQICRWFGVSPVMVGHMEKTTAWGTGLEQMNLWFLTYTLRPLLEAFEQEARRSLFTPVDRVAGYYAEFNVEGLLRTDSEKRANTFSALVNSGILASDEARAEYNKGPKPGGDQLTVASGRMPLDKLGQQPVTPPPDPGRQQDPTPPARAAA